MADVINMPKLGFDMAEGTLIRWVKQEGEEVSAGELLAEIETDKATVEVESQYSGIVHKHLVAEGAAVPVGQSIAVVGAEGEEIDVDSLVSSASDGEDDKPQETQPKESEEPAETVQESPGQVVDESTRQPSDQVTSRPSDQVTSTNGSLPDGLRASPLARRIAEDQGADLRAIQGSGPKGRIVKKDVESFLESGGGAAMPGLPAIPMADTGPVPANERVPLTRLRAAIGRRMQQSRTDIPHFYVTHEYDMGRVMDARKQANALLEGSGEKLSVNDFIIKASALALRQYPNLNASLDGDAVLRHGHVNIGVAVAVENGLLTVVCRDADRKPLRQISMEVKQMAERVRSGKVQVDDIEGSTFSISNLGMYDVAQFVAIINPPEAAILATGAAQQVPVVENSEIRPGWRMRATISVDHRVSDGAEAAQFLQALATYLENPVSLFMQ
jgi:pyruvate dehydrogenase E2 component (dihydrolipoamide acetyltransferase)